MDLDFWGRGRRGAFVMIKILFNIKEGFLWLLWLLLNAVWEGEIKRNFSFPFKGKNALAKDRSPPQELEVDPLSGP